MKKPISENINRSPRHEKIIKSPRHNTNTNHNNNGRHQCSTVIYKGGIILSVMLALATIWFSITIHHFTISTTTTRKPWLVMGVALLLGASSCLPALANAQHAQLATAGSDQPTAVRESFPRTRRWPCSRLRGLQFRAVWHRSSPRRCG